jgi:hypothetical protein
MKKERRFDIDWIRVIAFDILIIYHVGMFFVPWQFHIKNDEIVYWMQWPMLFVNQWRIPILFVISGMGTRFTLISKTGTNYIKERFIRLLIPLIVGIFIIVSPQIYIERLAQGKVNSSFFEFYPQFFNGIYPEGNFSWNHLWFLPYLLFMSIIATPLFLNFRNEKSKPIFVFSNFLKKNPFRIFALMLPFFIVEYFLHPIFPITHAFIGDWYALVYYFMFFIIGFLLVSTGNLFWESLNNVKFYALVVGIISFTVLLLILENKANAVLTSIFKTLNVWSWILTIFGFGSSYLNNESKLIKYRNQAVYPFYILHQTITIIIGYWLMNNTMHYMWKFVIMVIGTFGFSWLIYEFVIRRVSIIRPFFGLKNGY